MPHNDSNQTNQDSSYKQPTGHTNFFRERARMPLAQRNPALAEKIEQLRLTIAPIVHVRTGVPPPAFPSSMLQLFLLTESQLDFMAQYYSQTTPSTPNSLTATSNPLSPTNLRYAYPQTMDWSRPFLSTDPTLPENCKLTDIERLKVKMRMFARFIGMRGTETPKWEYERQVEVLRNKIERSVRDGEENMAREKFCWGKDRRMS
ncbi:hypothetical protein P280DRAFT_155965 [Massarina eburnea CBS 473.64]|uniref:Uncharacterized protein n=1 Tax=Massarina eburnea CBS 473.64 TaxID=1395130 RepID=A0A6A6RM20_9PLEO|nr:hypothetical protein P280DRAFT_155965 [Massarina eburnea CBS 473.64]